MPPDKIEEQKSHAAFNEFVFAFGLAIITWQEVETRLYNLYLLMCPGDGGTIANATYHVINSFEVKAAIIDAMVKLHISDKEVLAKWKTLLHQIQRRKKIRDKLVHWSVIKAFNEDKFDAVYLTPPITDARNVLRQDFLKPPSGALKANDIVKFIVEFSQTAQEIGQFSGAWLELKFPRKSP
jgi:hypothetical protein